MKASVGDCEPQSVAGGRGVNMWLDLGLCVSLLCCCTTTSDAQGFMCSAGISKQICLPGKLGGGREARLGL